MNVKIILKGVASAVIILAGQKATEKIKNLIDKIPEKKNN